jgi:hypothetical protein
MITVHRYFSSLYILRCFTICMSVLASRVFGLYLLVHASVLLAGTFSDCVCKKLISQWPEITDRSTLGSVEGWVPCAFLQQDGSPFQSLGHKGHFQLPFHLPALLHLVMSGACCHSQSFPISKPSEASLL